MAAIFGEVTNIDRRTCSRVVPMRVICAGLPRTGTASLRAALKRLGYEDTYHMVSAAFENMKDCEMWMDAIRAKFDGIGKFEKEDWDQLLGHCQAVTDSPCASFVPELVKAYPEAKVILNTRDVDAWYTSVSNTIEATLPNVDAESTERPEEIVRNQMLKKIWDVTIPGGFEKEGKAAFCKHYDAVRQAVPSEKLLEYSVKEGWEPLCKFLGVPVPDEPFPRLNDTAMFLKSAKKFGLERLQSETSQACP
ncbi:hypothetical protein PRK78_006921 [Emydomyces testavorans]|uniref:Uncharacterized protein n=1 Tax=Emydomyces testavorans TaxID=2070801 RepID=A0AAF0DQ92_9EURO|nr:hypothetical protein PRK78_006921 [Emydomyces testavorans]